MRSVKLAATGAAAALLFTLTVFFAAPAGAWVTPTVRTVGGACTGGSDTRVPITWIVTNLEGGFKGSPLKLVNVKISPDTFPVPTFATLANTGDDEATATTPVPAGFSGKVVLTFTPRFEGSDGNHTLPAVTAVVNVPTCLQVTTTTRVPPPPPPPVVTTTTTRPTTTTVPSTTTTVVAVQAAQVQAPAAVAVAAQPTFTG